MRNLLLKWGIMFFKRNSFANVKRFTVGSRNQSEPPVEPPGRQRRSCDVISPFHTACSRRERCYGVLLVLLVT